MNLILENRYFEIDQHLVRYFVYYGECLSSPPRSLSMQSKNYPYSFNDLHQSETMVGILANCEQQQHLYLYSCSSVEILMK